MEASAALKKQMCRYLCLSMLVAMGPMALSCYGHFPLTKAVYRMNGDIGGSLGDDRTQHHIVQSVVMWVLVIIPVYGVAMFADAVVLNLVQFWTGDVVQLSSVEERDGTRVALQPSADGSEALLTVSRNGQMITEQHVVRINSNTFEMRDATGTLTGMILKTPEGNIQLEDAQGRVIRTLAAKDLADLPKI